MRTSSTSSRFFWERVKDVLDHEKPEGVIVQLGGQTALKIAQQIEASGVKILGTDIADMDLAEDRGKFSAILRQLEIPFPRYGMAHDPEEAVDVAEKKDRGIRS